MTSVHTSELLPAALAHAGQGFSVFPLHPNSKRPVITRWEQHSTRDPARIRTWWRRRPTDNIAIACGPSRLHVLDLDTSHHTPMPNTAPTAVEGQQTLARLAADHNRTLPVPTYTVITPSGGMHLYYAVPVVPALRNSCGRLGPHIDSRGHGGYVVAAGSTLPHGRYRIVDDRTPSPLPGWLAQLLTNSPAPAAAPNAPKVITHPDGYVRAALTNQAARIRAARTGTRHRTILLAANSLGRLVGAGLLDHDHAYTALADAASIHVGVDAFTHTEAHRTITDGLSWAAARATSTRHNLSRHPRLTG
ncbi:bifunctional DNA primase/polymerase [Nocardia cyriacigeorgica]|uniref:bifunctional DNA primase/polymerase n=1 Tax=Nocardia cyriacigeorgica TaxID=135487 RepID=UPI00189513A0|nr:bifunctional DNA primase/polymerase [Nocardia cyriacigeorgica]MBF6324780.1 bifunctional DNA primase/polymerase [Nocardia cyriacigeorgica]